MAPRVTDRKKKKILADYVDLESYNAVAKANGVCGQTVRRIVEESQDISDNLKRKKEQNTLDMLAFMDSRKEKIQSVIDLLLEEMPNKIQKASLVQCGTVYGILVQRSTELKEEKKQEEKVTVVIDV